MGMSYPDTMYMIGGILMLIASFVVTVKISRVLFRVSALLLLVFVAYPLYAGDIDWKAKYHQVKDKVTKIGRP